MKSPMTPKVTKESKIFISGIAGLVGQNLALRLSTAGYKNICGVDKHKKNLSVLNEIQPNVKTELADISKPSSVWENLIEGADVVIINQAQIGGLDYREFHQNNVVATQNILTFFESKTGQNPYFVQISSSVVNSAADDFYTRSKTAQEKLFLDSNVKGVVLRPTLMFGWFDRKHLGWLQKFMSKTPVFPIPGNGKYRRQPLYVGDFCNVIISCIQNQPVDSVYDISGREIIDYIDLIKTIKKVTKQKTLILKIPYSFFFVLIWTSGLILKKPPFTIHQLRALVIPETFKIIDWAKIFNVSQTSFYDAVDETFNHKKFSKIKLDF